MMRSIPPLPTPFPLHAMLGSLPSFPWYGWTFVLSLIGIVFWAWLVSTQQATTNAGEEDFDRSFPVEPGVRTQAAEVRDIAIGAPLNSVWSFPINTLRTGASVADMRDILLDAWGVSSPSQARDTLRWLLDEGHRGGFDAVLRVAGDSPGEKSPQELDAAYGPGSSTRLAEPWGHYVATHQALRSRGFLQSPDDLSRGTAAWDWSRAVTVARFALSAELLEEADAWTFVREAGRRSRECFASWDEFLRSYVIGRALWNGMGQLDDPGIAQMIENVRSAPDSPWQMVAWS